MGGVLGAVHSFGLALQGCSPAWNMGLGLGHSRTVLLMPVATSSPPGPVYKRMGTIFSLWGTEFALVKHLAQDVMMLLRLVYGLGREDTTGLQGHSQTWEDSPSILAGLAEQIPLLLRCPALEFRAFF